MKVVILIPARGGSKGIPRKNLHPLNRKPLLWYAVQTGKQCFMAETWVSTEDAVIAEHAKSWGVNVIDRPMELAGDTSSVEEVIDHFTINVEYDILVLLSPTSPLTRAVWVNQGIGKILNGECDTVFSGMSMEGNDLLFWDKETMTPVNYSLQNRGIRQDRKDKYIIETGAFYITTREAYMKSGCRLSGKIGYVDIPFWASFEIDNVSDMKHVEYILKGTKGNG